MIATLAGGNTCNGRGRKTPRTTRQNRAKAHSSPIPLLSGQTRGSEGDRRQKTRIDETG